MTQKKKPATPSSASVEPQRVDDTTQIYELAPLEAARRFLEHRSVAYDESAKSYWLREETTASWQRLNGKIGRAHV